MHLDVDSTGLKIFGEGDWLEQKHRTKRKRRSWRKLHLGLDLVSSQIVCSELTSDDIGDPTALPSLLDQIDGRVDLFLADGAYEGEDSDSVDRGERALLNTYQEALKGWSESDDPDTRALLKRQYDEITDEIGRLGSAGFGETRAP